MRVRTTARRDGIRTCMELNVLAPDADGDVLISTKRGEFYIMLRDVPNLIRALQWTLRRAIRTKKHRRSRVG